MPVPLRERFEQVREAIRVLRRRDPASDDERQRDKAELPQVRALIERCHVVRWGDGQAELSAQAMDGKLQGLERRAEHMLDNHQPAFGCHDDPIRSQGAMRDAFVLLVEGGQRGRELPDQLDGKRRAAGLVQQIREPAPGRLVGHQGERRAGLQPFDRANAPDRRMTEAVELLNAFAQCGFERRSAAELSLESQELERGRGAVVEHQQPVAEGIRQPRRIPARQTRPRTGRRDGVIDDEAAGSFHQANGPQFSTKGSASTKEKTAVP